MGKAASRDPVYPLGRSEEEAKGLEERAKFYNPLTRHLFQSAGISTGMTVLDIGSGSGDVALLAGELVGSSGRVVGIDMNPDIVQGANARARAAGMRHVSFVAGDIRETEVGNDFDAAVGRFVLMYSADPATTLRAALRAVRETGLAAFYEWHGSAGTPSYPLSPLHESLGRWVREGLVATGAELDMGLKLHRVFTAAGLQPPQLCTDAVIGCGRDWVEQFVDAFGSRALRSVMPQLLQRGIATREEIDIETFDDRYRDEVLRLGSVIQWLTLVGAWARKRTSV